MNVFPTEESGSGSDFFSKRRGSMSARLLETEIGDTPGGDGDVAILNYADFTQISLPDDEHPPPPLPLSLPPVVDPDLEADTLSMTVQHHDRGDHAVINRVAESNCTPRPNKRPSRFRANRKVGIEVATNSEENESEDDVILVHSISSNTTVLVPETHRSPRVRETVSKFESNFSSRPWTAQAQRNLPRPLKRSVHTARQATTSENRLILEAGMGGDDKVDNLSLFPVSSRADTARAVHPINQEEPHPNRVFGPIGNERTIDVSDPYRIPYSSRSNSIKISSRPETARTDIVREVCDDLQEEEIENARQLYRANGDQDSLDDPEDIADEETAFQITESLYKISLHQTVQGEPIYRFGLVVGNLVDYLWEFINIPVQIGFTIKSRIIRRKMGTNGTFFPQYFMYYERDNGQQILLMTARKVKTLFPTYVITTDPAEFSKKSESCVGILEGNFRRSKFDLFSGSFEDPDGKTSRGNHRLVVSFVNDEDFCMNGPRLITVAIPKLRSDVLPTKMDSKLKIGDDRFTQLKNKEPIWSENTNTYVLNFRDRVHMSSVKNFVLINPVKKEQMILLFGKNGKNEFVLDFSYPFCPLQAFAMALASYEVKWGLE